jgi:hypothetical protein
MRESAQDTRAFSAISATSASATSVVRPAFPRKEVAVGSKAGLREYGQPGAPAAVGDFPSALEYGRD